MVDSPPSLNRGFHFPGQQLILTLLLTLFLVLPSHSFAQSQAVAPQVNNPESPAITVSKPAETLVDAQGAAAVMLSLIHI